MTVPPCLRLGFGEPPLDRYPEICSAFAHSSRSKWAGTDRAEPDGLISRIMGKARATGRGDAVWRKIDAPFVHAGQAGGSNWSIVYPPRRGRPQLSQPSGTPAKRSPS
jgi:hypothetical protein